LHRMDGAPDCRSRTQAPCVLRGTSK
jgi:hypothetical protein